MTTRKVAYSTFNALKKKYVKLEEDLIKIGQEVKILMEELKALTNKANAIQKFQSKLVEKVMKERRAKFEKDIEKDKQISKRLGGKK